MEHFKYPRIPHIPGSRGTSDDVYGDSYPTGTYDVFEKLDGTCVGIMVGPDKQLVFMNRGGFIDDKRPHEQWGALKKWGYEHYLELVDMLYPFQILWGEWLWARHSIKYDRLPDHFIAFDVWNWLHPEKFSQVQYDPFKEYVEKRGFTVTPRVATTPHVSRWMAKEADKVKPQYSDELEGFIFRNTDDYSDVHKYVRPDFMAGTEEHWFNREVEINTVSML